MTASKIELIYENTCPNIDAARQQIKLACNKLDIKPDWLEWEVSAADAPKHIHGYGSPTILVNGKDVSGEMTAGDDYCCRVYANSPGNKGVPIVNDIMQAIQSANTTNSMQQTKSRWTINSAMLPAVGVALLPKLACPACWPAYAGLLSAIGLGFIDYTPYLLPLTVLFLTIALVALIVTARQKKNYKPLVLGIVASVILLTGKFYFDSDSAMYVGMAMLVIASLWNTWPITSKTDTSCSTCVHPTND